MTKTVQDICTALRGFRRTPAFALTVITILAIGIGMSVAMFTTFRAIMVRRLPVANQDRIAVLWTYRVPGAELSVPVSDLTELRRDSRTMRDIAGVAHWGVESTPFVDGTRALTLAQVPVTTNFFDVLGARPWLGRFMVPDDRGPGPRGIVLSYRAWQVAFGGRRSIVGQRLISPANHAPFTIVGVAPPGLDYPVGVDAWLAVPRDYGVARVLAVGRLADGATLDGARDEFLANAQRLEPTLQLTGATAQTFTHAVLGDVRPVLVALTAAAALVLLIACVNVGGLFLVRASGRARELALRRVLGASYTSLVRQLVTESGLLAIGGGAAGLAVASFLMKGFALYAPSSLPRVEDISLHSGVFAVAVGVTALTVFLFGLVPALGAARVDIQTPLRHDTRAGSGTRRGRSARDAIVAAQVALALVTLAGAGLVARSLEHLEQQPLGYQPDHVSVLSVAVDVTRYDSAAQVRLTEQMTQSLKAIPGVIGVSPIESPPFLSSASNVILLAPEGQARRDVDASPAVPYDAVAPDYFRTLGIPVVGGRSFLDSDRPGTQPVVVISEAVGRHFWPGQNPIGKRIRVDHAASPSLSANDPLFEWRTVVGVAGDTHFRDLRRAAPTIYFPWQQEPGLPLYFALRSATDIRGLDASVRQVVRQIDPTIAVFGMQSIDQLLAAPLAEPRLNALVLTSFGAIALLLAAVGLYGVVASAVRDRRREIGIRIALGASPARVRDSLVREALSVVGFGACVGMFASLLTARFLRSLLFGISPTDPTTLAAVCAVLLAVALLAAYLPARHATEIDPAQALRSD